MESRISTLLSHYERGKISRRQLVAGMSSMIALLGTGSLPGAGKRQESGQSDEAEPTFRATGLNHIALQVTDVPRSRDFYVRHLGLTVRREGEQNCFLNCGKHFVALFKSDTAQMDHYCYSIDEYDVGECEARLKAEGIEPRVVRSDGRIYFPDPDGLTVQLAQTPR